MRRVCVFCGAASGADARYATAARELGRSLADRSIGLVTGGGKVGLMGVVADAALAAGGEVIGVIPRFLERREVAHRGLTGLHVVDSLHERKALMHELSDGFISLPGGFGTLDELMEAITWAQLGLHAKPIGIVNVAGYFDELLAFVEGATRAGFISAGHGEILTVRDDAAALVEALTERGPGLRCRSTSPGTPRV